MQKEKKEIIELSFTTSERTPDSFTTEETRDIVSEVGAHTMMGAKLVEVLAPDKGLLIVRLYKPNLKNILQR